ncbi:heme exporter protein CcmD [Duganella sp. sic0402]|uniref:heme exporter protein CcmD n=1 Tax=Duganella sp. sic0402 TaxID=2854786 RepID=UPI001C46B639|nr:heme exporter protein CcmD [Duganella sp. sic0402]MBV7536786.1 heme exporter protein CcmD [Duganella sp. sic0402]
MIWNKLSEFWAMGGYALYVWGSMAVVALCMGFEMWHLRRRHAQARSLAEQAQGRPARAPAVVQYSSHGVQDEAAA